jgi:16S rRNA (cytosine967-C5)-methyltransferase
VKEWVDQIGMETENLLRVLNTQSNVSLRVNLLKTTREECHKRLLNEGTETEVSKISPVGLISPKRFHCKSSASFNDGWYEMQDEGSQLISFIADPQPGEIVIDACAGSGGKSLHMAQLMKNTGEIIAADVDKNRLAELRKRAKRSGANIIQTEHRTNLATDNLSGKADLVLVDAPCSGVGTIRRNPWQKWNITESLIQHYAEKQKNILQFNSQFVKPGGKLVYATCSLFRQENDDVVKSFLSSHPDFVLTYPEKILERFNLSLKNSTITIYPHHYNTDGFFIAVMKRVN